MTKRHNPTGLSQSTALPTRTVRLHGLAPAALANWLEQVIPHLDDDDTLPFLTRVHVRLAAGRMHAFATDRYTGAITTLPAATSERARFTLPGDFARLALEWLRPEGPSDDGPVTSVDVTITDRLFALTIHQDSEWCYERGEGEFPSYIGPNVRRLAVRLDPDTSTVNLPAMAAEALAAPAVHGPVDINTAYLMRFLGSVPVLPFDPATGRLMPDGENLLGRFAVHNTGRVLVLTRPDFLGILATIRRRDDVEDAAPEEGLPATRTYWRHALATIA